MLPVEKEKELESKGYTVVHTADDREYVLPPWSTLDEDYMEIVMWAPYMLIIFFQALGVVYAWPVGMCILMWLQFMALYDFIELVFGGDGDFWTYMMGPWMRAYISQPFILNTSFMVGLFPVFNLLAFPIGWWAVADYYGYNYELFKGPQIPEEYYV